MEIGKIAFMDVNLHMNMRIGARKHISTIEVDVIRN